MSEIKWRKKTKGLESDRRFYFWQSGEDRALRASEEMPLSKAGMQMGVNSHIFGGKAFQEDGTASAKSWGRSVPRVVWLQQSEQGVQDVTGGLGRSGVT